MEIQVHLKEWKFKEDEGVKKIVGSYSLKAGAALVAYQSFNEGYNSTTIPFSSQLSVDIEKLTERIEAEIVKNFTGKEE